MMLTGCLITVRVEIVKGLKFLSTLGAGCQALQKVKVIRTQRTEGIVRGHFCLFTLDRLLKCPIEGLDSRKPFVLGSDQNLVTYSEVVMLNDFEIMWSENLASFQVTTEYSRRLFVKPVSQLYQL